MMTEEDEDESPWVNTDETDEEAQDTGLAFDDDLDSEVNDLDSEVNNLDSEVDDFIIEEDGRIFMAMVHPVII
jgi:hypothetical protein